MEYTMYESLLQLPLFQGMSKADLTKILEKVRFNFLKYENEEIILRQGEKCDKLIFLLSGTLVRRTVAPCNLFTLEETISHPTVIEFHSLFGINTCYKATYSSQGEVALLTIDKQYVFRVLDLHMVFRINFFNLLSSKTEKLHSHLWSITPKGLEGRLAHFIRSLCNTPHGHKILYAKMDDLAALLDDTRLNVSNVLNKWQHEGHIEMRRKEYVIPDLARLKSI